MKSEERHQLLTNDLSVVTTKTVGFFERHAGTMIAAVIGVLLVSAVGYWWTSSTDSGVATGWTMLDTAEGLEDYGSVVDKFKGQPPGQWAQLQVAEKTLQTAMPLMFTNREIALTDVKRAREGFESLLQDKTIPPTVRERALWGMALCLETACSGDTSKPVEAFGRLIDDFPDSIFKVVAEERIAALKKSDAGEFYAWFSKEKPQPPEARPRDFKDGIHLPAPTDTDDEPDDFVPSGPGKASMPATTTKEPVTAEGEKTEPPVKPAEKPETDAVTDPAKAVEGEKPAGAVPPKDGEKPIEKTK